MTAGREQDARETLRDAVEALCAQADRRLTLPGYVLTADLRATIAAHDALAALLPSPPATTGAAHDLARRFALSAAFRHGWERGAWHVSDASGGYYRCQQAAADKDQRRADSDAYVDAALAASSPPATTGAALTASSWQKMDDPYARSGVCSTLPGCRASYHEQPCPHVASSPPATTDCPACGTPLATCQAVYMANHDICCGSCDHEDRVMPPPDPAEAFVEAALEEEVSWEVANLNLTVGDIVTVAKWLAPVAASLAVPSPAHCPRCGGKTHSTRGPGGDPGWWRCDRWCAADRGCEHVLRGDGPCVECAAASDAASSPPATDGDAAVRPKAHCTQHAEHKPACPWCRTAERDLSRATRDYTLPRDTETETRPT